MKKLVPLFILLFISIAIAFMIPYSKTALSSSSKAEESPKLYPTVIIDAGHGGFDGGASTDEGYPEKDINLKIALKLNDYLQSFGFKTVLTRTEDTSLNNSSLTTVREKKRSDIMKRFQIMNETDHAVFISIHQNHFSEEKYSGAQIFYSPNSVEQSSALAKSIQESFVSLLQPNNTRQIKECGDSVYLIYHAVCPAVLAECGFLSNREEASLLLQDEYQEKVAFTLAVGILDYISIKEE